MPMTDHVGLLALEAHAVVGRESRAFGNEHHGIAARMSIAIVRQQLGQVLDVDGVFGDDASVRRAGHRRQQCR